MDEISQMADAARDAVNGLWSHVASFASDALGEVLVVLHDELIDAANLVRRELINKVTARLPGLWGLVARTALDSVIPRAGATTEELEARIRAVEQGSSPPPTAVTTRPTLSEDSFQNQSPEPQFTVGRSFS
jgi:hypothetical protein